MQRLTLLTTGLVLALGSAPALAQPPGGVPGGPPSGVIRGGPPVSKPAGPPARIEQRLQDQRGVDRTDRRRGLDRAEAQADAEAEFGLRTAREARQGRDRADAEARGRGRAEAGVRGRGRDQDRLTGLARAETRADANAAFGLATAREAHEHAEQRLRMAEDRAAWARRYGDAAQRRSFEQAARQAREARDIAASRLEMARDRNMAQADVGAGVGAEGRVTGLDRAEMEADAEAEFGLATARDNQGRGQARGSASGNVMFDAHLRQAFTAIDANGDGRITRAEWGGWQDDDGVYTTRFNDFDLDGDASLSWDEYRRAVLGLSGRADIDVGS